MKFNKGSLIPCPVLTPNNEEFADPIAYLSSPYVRQLGNEYGLLKVVPPANFKPEFHISPYFKFHTRLQKLGDLGLNTRSRKFFTDSINRFLKMRRKRQIRYFFKVYITPNSLRKSTRSSLSHSSAVAAADTAKLDQNSKLSGLGENGANGSESSAHDSNPPTEAESGVKYEDSATNTAANGTSSTLNKEINESIPADNQEPTSPHNGSHVKLETLEGPTDTSRSRSVVKRVYYYDVYVSVENFGGFSKMTEENWQKLNAQFGIPVQSQEIKKQYESTIQSYAKYINSHQNEEFPDSDSEDEFASCLICGNHSNPSQTLLCDNCDNAFHMSCLSPPMTEVPQGSWYCSKCLIGTGEYGFEEDVDVKYTLHEFWKKCQDFDAKFIQEYNNGQPLTVDVIERKFWEFVDVQKSDLVVNYGADIHNLVPGEISGFPMINTPGINISDPLVQYYINHPFNLTRLPFANGSLLNYINHAISGMTVPWIYIGSLLATFCWHVEDHYTLSANYCHFGATKKWYGIPSYDADKFEKLMRDSAPDLFQKQPDLLHQLVTLLNPMQLVQNGIRCVYADQNPGEYIITYPRVYHSGFNCGFNFNEAVNFTMNNWLEFGERAIQDYRLSKKENVFNHYQLIENILRTFNNQPRINLANDYIDLVTRCCDSFEKFNHKQLQLLSKMNFTTFSVIHKPRKMRHHLYEFDESEDESLCDSCKTHISYQYCVVEDDNLKKLRKPNTQLITPEASPQEEAVLKSEKALSVPEQDSLQNLRSVSVMDEYDNLINEAKRAASEESTGSRRKSRRLEKKQENDVTNTSSTAKNSNGSRMGRIKRRKSLKFNSQEKAFVRLCLECTIKMSKEYEIPKGSSLIYEGIPENLQKLVDETRVNLQQLIT